MQNLIDDNTPEPTPEPVVTTPAPEPVVTEPTPEPVITEPVMTPSKGGGSKNTFVNVLIIALVLMLAIYFLNMYLNSQKSE